MFNIRFKMYPDYFVTRCYELTFHISNMAYPGYEEDIKGLYDLVYDYTNFNKPTRDGYQFIGFFTEKEGGKSFEEVMNSEAGIEEDTIFYARWKKTSGGGVPEPEEENPKTFDGITLTLVISAISIISLIGISLYFKKQLKNN